MAHARCDSGIDMAHEGVSNHVATERSDNETNDIHDNHDNEHDNEHVTPENNDHDNEQVAPKNNLNNDEAVTHENKPNDEQSRNETHENTSKVECDNDNKAREDAQVAEQPNSGNDANATIHHDEPTMSMPTSTANNDNKTIRTPMGGPAFHRAVQGLARHCEQQSTATTENGEPTTGATMADVAAVLTAPDITTHTTTTMIKKEPGTVGLFDMRSPSPVIKSRARGNMTPAKRAHAQEIGRRSDDLRKHKRQRNDARKKVVANWRDMAQGKEPKFYKPENGYHPSNVELGVLMRAQRRLYKQTVRKDVLKKVTKNFPKWCTEDDGDVKINKAVKKFVNDEKAYKAKSKNTKAKKKKNIMVDDSDTESSDDDEIFIQPVDDGPPTKYHPGNDDSDDDGSNAYGILTNMVEVF